MQRYWRCMGKAYVVDAQRDLEICGMAKVLTGMYLEALNDIHRAVI